VVQCLGEAVKQLETSVTNLLSSSAVEHAEAEQRTGSLRGEISDLRASMQKLVSTDLVAVQGDIETLRASSDAVQRQLEKLSREPQVRAEEDWRVEQLYAERHKTTERDLEKLKDEVKAHASGLEEVRKDLVLQRAERDAKQKELLGTIQDRLQTIVLKMDTTCVQNLGPAFKQMGSSLENSGHIDVSSRPRSSESQLPRAAVTRELSPWQEQADGPAPPERGADARSWTPRSSPRPEPRLIRPQDLHGSASPPALQSLRQSSKEVKDDTSDVAPLVRMVSAPADAASGFGKAQVEAQPVRPHPLQPQPGQELSGAKEQQRSPVSLQKLAQSHSQAAAPAVSDQAWQPGPQPEMLSAIECLRDEVSALHYAVRSQSPSKVQPQAQVQQQVQTPVVPSRSPLLVPRVLPQQGRPSTRIPEDEAVLWAAAANTTPRVHSPGPAVMRSHSASVSSEQQRSVIRVLSPMRERSEAARSSSVDLGTTSSDVSCSTSGLANQVPAHAAGRAISPTPARIARGSGVAPSAAASVAQPVQRPQGPQGRQVQPVHLGQQMFNGAQSFGAQGNPGTPRSFRQY